MPTYQFKCPACKQLMPVELPRKRKTYRDKCLAFDPPKSVVMRYTRTIKAD